MTAISWTNTCCDELTERWKSERDWCFINVWLGRPSGRSTRTSRMCLCMFSNACKIICCSRSIHAGHYSLEWEFFCRTCTSTIVEILTRGTSPELRSHILGDFQKESIQILLNFFYIADRVDMPNSKKALINLLHSTSMWVSHASLPAMIKIILYRSFVASKLEDLGIEWFFPVLLPMFIVFVLSLLKTWLFWQLPSAKIRD